MPCIRSYGDAPRSYGEAAYGEVRYGDAPRSYGDARYGDTRYGDARYGAAVPTAADVFCCSQWLHAPPEDAHLFQASCAGSDWPPPRHAARGGRAVASAACACSLSMRPSSINALPTHCLPWSVGHLLKACSCSFHRPAAPCLQVHQPFVAVRGATCRHLALLHEPKPHSSVTCIVSTPWGIAPSCFLWAEPSSCPTQRRRRPAALAPGNGVGGAQCSAMQASPSKSTWQQASAESTSQAAAWRFA